MAKGNYGVTSLGGSGGTGGGGTGSGSGGGSSGSSGKGGKGSKKSSSNARGFSLISESIAKGGFLPNVFEHGARAGASQEHIKSISEMTTHEPSSQSDIAAAFRQSKQKSK